MVRPIMSNRLGRTALALLALSAVLASTSTPLEAGGKRKSEVKVTATAGKAGADGKQTVMVVLEINSGWLVYANPVGNEDLESAAIRIKVSTKEKGTSFKVAFPTGNVKKDNLIGNYNVYVGKVGIPVTVQRIQGDSSPLEVTVYFLPAAPQKGLCYPSALYKFTLP